MLYFAGVDPDLHSLHTAVLVCNDEGTMSALSGIWTVKVKGAKDEEAVVQILRSPFGCPFKVQAVAVESQQVGYTGRTNAARPQDLIHLAQVAGGLVALWKNCPSVYLPSPQAWKGSVPKHIKQARIFSALGIKYSLAGGNCQYAVPENFKQYDKTGNLNAGDWIDAGDSVGLAVYAAERYFKEKKLTARIR